MIAVRLIGGLGNQMFQYAAARALADRLRTELVLDVRQFSHYSLHAYGLERFSVRARAASSSELARWPEWIRLPCRLATAMGVRMRWYVEPRFAYDRAWQSQRDNLLIEGYFQSEKYFSEIASRLQADFTPRAALSASNAAIAAMARDCESVMIHVRRGDYVSNANTRNVHGVCSPGYYESAIRMLRERLVAPRFFVFSNDMAWARANLPLGKDALFVDHNADAPEVDVHLMAQCRHHIIANSSFSWWGAWLGTGAAQIVVCPSPWFDDLRLSASDLIPSHWICVAK